PLTGRFVSNQQMRCMPIEVPAGRGRDACIFTHTKAVSEKIDVLLLSREESPTRASVKPARVFLQNGRRIVARIDTDRIEEDVLAHSLAEQLPHLSQTGRLERTGKLAVGIDEIEGNDLAFDQIIIEADPLTLLRCQNDVGKMAHTGPGAVN